MTRSSRDCHRPPRVDHKSARRQMGHRAEMKASLRSISVTASQADARSWLIRLAGGGLMARRVAIAGVALSGTVPSTPFELIARASSAALADAGLTPADVDGLASTAARHPGTDRGGRVSGPAAALDRLDVGRRRLLGGDGGARRRRHRRGPRRRRAADVRLHRPLRPPHKLRTAKLDWGSRGPLQWEVPYGHTLIAKYAMAARRHMHEYGTTIEQLAEIAVSARANAGQPRGSYRDPITIDDVLSGPMIADPFTKLHCCIRSDGGAAACSSPRTGSPTCRSRPSGCSARASTAHMCP